jgi:tRNA U34 5-methylaminomethyl-2-thiouridine-forming methyltransferase MnmC
LSLTNINDYIQDGPKTNTIKETYNTFIHTKNLKTDYFPDLNSNNFDYSEIDYELVNYLFTLLSDNLRQKKSLNYIKNTYQNFINQLYQYYQFLMMVLIS